MIVNVGSYTRAIHQCDGNLHCIRNAVSLLSPFEIQKRLKSNESVCVLSKLSLDDGCDRS